MAVANQTCKAHPGCGLLAWFSPANINAKDLGKLERLIEHQHHIQRKGYVIRAGDPLNFLYGVSSGSVKTCLTDKENRSRVTGFSLPGELVGVEGIYAGQHPCDSIALEDSICCGIRFPDLLNLTKRIVELQHYLLRVLSRKINRKHDLLVLLGNLDAEERVAQLLLGLSERHVEIGNSPSHFHLSMSRRDIGSYLGLKVETVSRVFTKLESKYILTVNGKDIAILSPKGLCDIVSPQLLNQ